MSRRNHKRDPLFQELAQLNRESWNKISSRTKKRKWDQSKRFGVDNPLLKLGITEELVNQEYNQYRRQLYNGKREKNDREKQIRGMTEEIDLLRREIIDRDNEVDELADQLTGIEVELEGQQSINEESQKKIVQLTEDSKHLNRRVSDLEEQLKDEKDIHIMETNGLKDQISSLHGKIDALQSRLNRETGELQSKLSRETDELKSEIDVLQNKLKRETESREREITLLKEQNDQLIKEFSSINRMITVMKGDHERFLTEFQDGSSKLSDIGHSILRQIDERFKALSERLDLSKL
jgi:desmoplakin